MLEMLISPLEMLVAALFFLLFVWLLWLTVNVKKIASNLKILKKDAGKPSVVSSLNELVRRSLKVEKDLTNISKELETIKVKLESAIVGVGLVRYNPFKDTGGNLSFSLALLDEKGNGVVITALNSRNDSRFYCKHVRGFVCEVPLSDEEKEAIRKVVSRLRSRKE